MIPEASTKQTSKDQLNEATDRSTVHGPQSTTTERGSPSTARRRIFLSPPHMGGQELAFVQEAFESNYIAPVGPMVDAFEREFARTVGLPYAVAVSSGTAAMHLAMRNLGVGPGDWVIASTLTFIGSISPVLFEGAVPIFVDSDPMTWNMDPHLLEAVIGWCLDQGKIQKAVIPTDLYGQCADYKRIVEICNRYDIPVVIDSAEALGAFYGDDHAGVGATAAVYSFNGNKILTTSGGGMLASANRDFIEAARFLSQQARDPVVHYEHSQLGYNYRMSNIVAAIGRGQLKRLSERVQQKRDITAYYEYRLGDVPGISFMPEAPYGQSNRWLTVILVDPDAFGADREEIRLALEAENIESRPVWKPMHLQPVFECTPIGDGAGQSGAERAEHGTEERKGLGGEPAVHGSRLTDHGRRRYVAYSVGGHVSEELFQKGLCLPSGTAMTEADLDRVVEVVRRTGIPGGRDRGLRVRKLTNE